jgi:hypothetical protein
MHKYIHAYNTCEHYWSSMYVCMFSYVYMYVYVCVYIHIYTNICMCVCIYIYTHTHTYTHTYMNTHNLTHNVHITGLNLAAIPQHIHMYTYTHAYIHTISHTMFTLQVLTWHLFLKHNLIEEFDLDHVKLVQVSCLCKLFLI